MFTAVEQWLVSHILSSRAAAGLMAGGLDLLRVVAELDADVEEIKALQAGQTVTLPALRETLFGAKRTITVVISSD